MGQAGLLMVGRHDVHKHKVFCPKFFCDNLDKNNSWISSLVSSLSGSRLHDNIGRFH